MKRNCSFRVLKCPLNLKFYDSDETVTLPENKIRTWLRSQQSLASATGCPGTQNTSGRCSWHVQPKTRQELAAQTKVVTSKRFVQSACGGCVTPDNRSQELCFELETRDGFHQLPCLPCSFVLWYRLYIKDGDTWLPAAFEVAGLTIPISSLTGSTEM